MNAKITRQQLAEKVLAGRAILVEALPEQHYLDRHLPGALHLPHDQASALAPKRSSATRTSAVAESSSLVHPPA